MRGARKCRRADQHSGGDADGNGSGKSCDGMVLITAMVHRRHGILPFFCCGFPAWRAVNSGEVWESTVASVIASAAKQSRNAREGLDCFVASLFAMTRSASWTLG